MKWPNQGGQNSVNENAVPRFDGLDAAAKTLNDLVERFARNLSDYRRPDYKEARLRVEFIDPMFEAMGWDISNRNGLAEQYKDVIHEDAIRSASGIKAPDYCFRIGGVRKFFLEAKKPSRLVFVHAASGGCLQLRWQTSWTGSTTSRNGKPKTGRVASP